MENPMICRGIRQPKAPALRKDEPLPANDHATMWQRLQFSYHYCFTIRAVLRVMFVKVGTLTVAAAYDRRQFCKLRIVGGHRPPLQWFGLIGRPFSVRPESRETSLLQCRPR